MGVVCSVVVLEDFTSAVVHRNTGTFGIQQKRNLELNRIKTEQQKSKKCSADHFMRKGE